MNPSQDLLNLVQQVRDYEADGAALTESWYQSETVDNVGLRQLHDLSSKSLTALQTLSDQFDTLAKQSSESERAQWTHAYQLVQELIQSRQASQEMMESIERGGSPYPEYFRALAVKEQAAKFQTQKLLETVTKPH